MEIKRVSSLIFCISIAAGITGCTTTASKIEKVEIPSVKKPMILKNEEPNLKRKVAIARFGNEAQYGKSNLFASGESYNAEKQATDILSAKLTQSDKFILLERSDLDKIDRETTSFNLEKMNIGADYLIVGSVSEFGRKNMSDTGVFSRSKIQVAYAKVNVRLIDVKTGQVIFAQEGTGESSSEAGTAFGVGTHIGYDSTLNDKAISAAISSVIDGVISNLLDKPWKSYILSLEDNMVLIAGGEKQGLKIGEIFSIYKKGKSIKNPQTGMLIELPGSKIADIQVLSQFGSNYTDEGSICQIINGNLKGVNLNDTYVQK